MAKKREQGQADRGKSRDWTPARQERKKGKGPSSGDRNEGGYPHDTAGSQSQDRSGTGRAASGESYEDEADDALLRPSGQEAPDLKRFRHAGSARPGHPQAFPRATALSITLLRSGSPSSRAEEHAPGVAAAMSY